MIAWADGVRSGALRSPLVGDGVDPDLNRWVGEYCAFGDHRTGTVADRATTGWFAGELAALGGRVTRHPFSFDRYDGDVAVMVDGVEVESDILHYEGVGAVITDRPHVASVGVMVGHETSATLVDEIDAARASGAELVVIATDHPLGELAMPNRRPVLGSGLPVVLVAGRHRDALAVGDLAVEFAATIVPAESENVVAWFGPEQGGAAPIVLATPLSGWFTCAAERASGIAVLLGVVERLVGDRLAGDQPLVVVGTSGHELLPHLGLDILLSETPVAAIARDAALVVHLGANVGVAVPHPATGELVLAPGLDAAPVTRGTATRGVMARLDGREPAVLGALADADLRPVVDPPGFLGEGAMWAAATSAPLLSFVGSSPWFHTPGDIAENTIDSTGLVTVADAIAATIDALQESPHG